MSRLTTAQIIEQGDYLKPDFDPASLTVSQLLGVFGFHNVMYPSPYTKPKLVQLFNDEIKARAPQLKKERLSRQNSQASDDGITDGLTGRPLNEGRKPATRSSSRRASVAPKDKEQVPEPSRPEPPRRRRSSAEPSLGTVTTRKRVTKAPEPLAEESEPEEPPVRKVSRKKASEAEAATRSRIAAALEDVDSGWEDNNIFQSGAESASPSPVKPRTRRSSALPHRSKKSSSVPPQFAPPPSPTKDDASRIPRRRTSVKPPQSSFEPALPQDMFRDVRATATLARRTRDVTSIVPLPEDEEPKAVTEVSAGVVEAETVVAEYDHRTPEAGPSTEHIAVVETTTVDAEALSEDFIDEGQSLVSSQGSMGQEVVRRKVKASGFGLMRFFIFMFATATLASLYNYKTESAPIGFCETGKSTNTILESVKVRRAAIEECNRMNRTTLLAIPYADGTQAVMSPTPIPTPEVSDETQLVLSEPCPPPPLLPIPRPESCAPCPDHASCTPATVTCEPGYLLSPHPLLPFFSVPGPSKPSGHNAETYQNPSLIVGPTFENLSVTQLAYTGLSLLLDGFPGLGPVALPPRCVLDPRRKTHVGLLGKAMDKKLIQERGIRHCLGARPDQDKSLSELEKAKKWGTEVDAFKETLKKKSPQRILHQYDDLFAEAIQQLVELDSIFIAEDTEGHRYIASREEEMDFPCQVKVWTLETGRSNWKQISGTLTALLLSVTVWTRRQSNREESVRAQALAEQVYELLRSAEFEHHVDPVARSVPYLSALQLRDELLHNAGVAERQRLWRRVERILGANANVVTTHEELEGGDEGVVWRWVGRVGQAVSYEPAREDGEVVPA
ncbi:hypothetical protein PHLGIDRAFT_12180 [Phlebiopsis gigantea 11061_1 CR5-6]|uniref:Man1/Src1 C-terminal domain-containing protein n=1 Tax=Phlebiopsis gigantea (strain 11061_1 CR5-6) TaxID=745531 RepID=A0A0C3PQ06_PHLG1|nr:hypothetical protein PHLGIDRAFT_12180 [Phlebiopsis gigantea 11061_1 CR5-6]